MEKVRSPFQGVWNIVRFNWHYYLLASIVVAVILFFRINFPESKRIFLDIILLLGIGSVILSLVISTYIYDFSNLYTLSWIDNLAKKNHEKIININAGFDETSVLLKNKYQNSELKVFDFYDPDKQTEISIQRARKAYPPFPGTIQIKTTALPVETGSVDKIFAILAAHEIRNITERESFFKELHRILSPDGHIIVTEHLRDTANFLAYNIGAFHFHSRNTWLNAFRIAELKVTEEIKITPFITTFILTKNGTSS